MGYSHASCHLDDALIMSVCYDAKVSKVYWDDVIWSSLRSTITSLVQPHFSKGSKSLQATRRYTLRCPVTDGSGSTLFKRWLLLGQRPDIDRACRILLRAAIVSYRAIGLRTDSQVHFPSVSEITCKNRH